MKRFTYDQLPDVVSHLYERVEALEKLLENSGSLAKEKKDLLTIAGAAKFLKLSISTLYSKVCRHEIPVNKQGKRLYFYKSELSSWIKLGRKKTNDELFREVNAPEKKNLKK